MEKEGSSCVCSQGDDHRLEVYVRRKSEQMSCFDGRLYDSTLVLDKDISADDLRDLDYYVSRRILSVLSDGIKDDIIVRGNCL